ncbi:hypothetical protein D8M04_13950 [Oceanobacillus piezotolerans]|uniref:YusW-like protein n=1 Tax=Oceanobacillus piezotolerans TaxID=2448030 RepID=A0A498D8G4_9BACI|nr:YusW family protein [Oceanobacillus piezotolerans]RLL42656.1 hypothetical protein D8M04_13950 [Oceanobacillus piezotolerans]
MKKEILWIGSMMILSLVLVACGDNDEVENPPQNKSSENQQQADGDNTNTNTNTDTTTNSDYGFKKFELDADYQDNNDALDVDFENEQNDKMEASYRDKSQDIDLNDDAAMEELDKIFSSFNFDENTSDEEVLDSVAEAFNIPEDAQNMELEIEFSNGTEKAYQR